MLRSQYHCSAPRGNATLNCCYKNNNSMVCPWPVRTFQALACWGPVTPFAFIRPTSRLRDVALDLIFKNVSPPRTLKMEPLFYRLEPPKLTRGQDTYHPERTHMHFPETHTIRRWRFCTITRSPCLTGSGDASDRWPAWVKDTRKTPRQVSPDANLKGVGSNAVL